MQAGLIYWQYYLIWLAVISGVTFLVYGLDKAMSRRGGRRVPEAVLHWLSLSGGFSGGWAGRLIFRHKTRKGFFTFVLLVSTVVHLAMVYWLIFYLPL